MLKGSFRPQYPQLLYPVISSEKDGCLIVACYLPMTADLKESTAGDIYIINASDSERVIFELSDKKCTFIKTVYDCCGRIVEQGLLDAQGITTANVPVSGLLHLSLK